MRLSRRSDMSTNNEEFRAAAKAKAIEVAKKDGADWNSLPLNEQEARILTQGHKLPKQ
jgi:hypothetical protein